MATGSSQYKYLNTIRAGGGGSAASRRSPQRGTTYQTTDPNAPNYSPF